MSTVYLALTTGGAALLSNVAIIPMLLALSHRFRWYDDIDHRKIHTGDMPHVGGIGIVLSSAFALGLFAALKNAMGAGATPGFARLLPFIAAYLIVHVTGLIDDFADLRARYKFALQFAAACIIAFTGNRIHSVAFPWGGVLRLGPAAYGVTIFWLVGISNAVNFIDGMDGLAGGISAIAALGYAVIMVAQGHVASAAVAFAVLGAAIGFLVYNRPPARIFMGDSGALTLGFVLGSLPLIEASGDGNVELLTVLIPVSLLLVPVLDTLASILRRLRDRRRISTPDRLHTHHKLLDLGLSQPKVLLVIYALCLVPAGSVAAWAATGGGAMPWLLVVAAAWLVCAGFFMVLDRRYWTSGKSRRR